MGEEITNEEAYEYCLSNFLKWLDVLAMEPVELCDTWGNYNVAWELVNDLKTDGQCIVSMACGYLSESQKLKVRDFLGSLEAIPKSLLLGTTTVQENVEAMSHPCWQAYKKSSVALVQCLEPAAKRNRKFFE